MPFTRISVGAMKVPARALQLVHQPAFGAGCCDMLGDALRGGLVDDGADIGATVPRDRPCSARPSRRSACRTGRRRCPPAHKGSAAPSSAGPRIGRRFRRWRHRLFGQGGAVDDHRVQAAGFRDQRRAGGAVFGHGCADLQRGGGGAGEGHAVDARIRGQRRADIAAAGQQLQRVRGTPASCSSSRRDARSAGSARPVWPAPRCLRPAPPRSGRRRSPAESSTG